MRIAIVDDCKLDCILLTERLKKYMSEQRLPFELEVFASAEEFLEKFTKGAFDIVFLDICMDGMNGMDAAKQIYRDDPECRIIFQTSSEDYLRQSYSVHTVYYLIKPIVDEEFQQAMDFCKLKPEYAVPELDLKTSGYDGQISTESILFIDVNAHTTVIHLPNHAVKLYRSFTEVTAPLKEDDRFLFCGRGIVVNFQNVKEFTGESFVMTDGSVVPVSLRQKKSIANVWNDYRIKVSTG